MDYHSGPYTVTFFPETTSAAFDIIITNDDTFRGTRMFQISIDQTSLPNNIVTGSIGQATVTIVEDDCKYNFY